MLSVCIGFDPRQPIAYQVAAYSVAVTASKPVAITPLFLKQLPITRRGLTEFTYSRFLTPYLAGFKGQSVFMDPDMVLLTDIHELIQGSSKADPMHAVSVVKAQPKFEWPSLMVFSNSACKRLTPEFVNNPDNSLFDFAWAPTIGELDPAWNVPVGYQEHPEPKLLHYTQGIPIWPETQDLKPEPWFGYHKSANSSVSFEALMGPSVHAKHVYERLKQRVLEAADESGS